jgi:hypothetical protein
MAASRLIDKIRKASTLEPVKKEVVLSNGEPIVMWISPLTAAEKQRAKKDARSDDIGEFALQLLVRKAKDANGRPLFTPGDIPVLKNEVRDEDLNELLLAVIGGSDEEEEPMDMKSSADAAE